MGGGLAVGGLAAVAVGGLAAGGLVVTGLAAGGLMGGGLTVGGLAATHDLVGDMIAEYIYEGTGLGHRHIRHGRGHPEGQQCVWRIGAESLTCMRAVTGASFVTVDSSLYDIYITTAPSLLPTHAPAGGHQSDDDEGQRHHQEACWDPRRSHVAERAASTCSDITNKSRTRWPPEKHKCVDVGTPTCADVL